MNKSIIKFLCILGIIIATCKIIFPRTSLNFRYRLYYSKFGKYLKTQEKILISGETFYLRVKTINQRISFSSSDIKVAYVNKLGKVTAYKPGTAYIKVKLSDDTLICRVRVIKLNHETLKLSIGETKKLNVKGNWFFEDYKSSDKSIVTVTSSGKVTAIGSGNAIITATAKGRKLTCKVSVE